MVTYAAEHWQVSSLTTLDGNGQTNNPVNLPYFIALPVVFSASGLVPVVPSSTAKSFAERWARNWRPMPFELQGFTMRLHWNIGRPSAGRIEAG